MNLIILAYYCFTMANLVAPKKRAAEQGRKALFSILNVCNKNYFNIEAMLSVFDTYVNTVLSYGSEMWGSHPGQDVEKIHLLFCKTNYWGYEKEL